MSELLKVQQTLFNNGERFPVVVTATGMPEYYPNIFLTSTLRVEHKQGKTLYNAACAVKDLRLWELLSGVDVVERMLEGQFLDLEEVEELVETMWHSCKSLLLQFECKREFALAARSKVCRLDTYREIRQAARVDQATLLKPGTVAGKLVYVVKYLRFLGKQAIRAAIEPARRSALEQGLEDLLCNISRRIPEAHSGFQFAEYQRLGLTYQVESLLREVIVPGHPANPWKKKTQLRNSMIVKVLLSLGIRRGELLNLRIDDFDFRENKVRIRRLPDNPDDPRLYEPNVKTLERVLRMKDDTADLIQDYIVTERRKFRGARKHDFLLVSSQDGAPLSLRSVNLVFTELRRKVPGIPVDFNCHICRFTWNDRFSDLCDLMKIDAEREKKIRCDIMGWVHTSEMAAVYTKRTAQAAADQYLLICQEDATGGKLTELVYEITSDRI